MHPESRLTTSRVIFWLAAAPLPVWLALVSAKPLGYDETLHVLIARTGGWLHGWGSFRAAILDVAHPPLFFLELKALLRVAQGRVVDRVIPAVAAVAATFWLGSIVRRLGVRSFLCILAVIAFGFSLSLGNLATDTRGYTSAIAWLLLALDGLIELGWQTGGAISRPALKTAAGTCLAFWTEYESTFVIAALIVSVAILATGARGRVLRGRLRKGGAILIAGAVTLAISGAFLYVVHIRLWAHPLNHLPGFYYGDIPGEGLAAFLARATRPEIRLFVPGWIVRPVRALSFGLFASAFSVWGAAAAWRNSRGAAYSVRVLPAALLAGTFLAIAAAASLKAYPLGFDMRHQAVLFPLAIISVFVALDELWRAAPPPAQTALAAAVCGAVFWNSSLAMIALRNYPEPFLAEPIAERAAAFPERTIVAGQYTALGALAHFDRYRWKFLSRAGRRGQLDLIQVEMPGAPILVVRENEEWILDPREASAWKLGAATLEDLSLSCAAFAGAGNPAAPGRPSQRNFELAVRSAAAHSGLAARVMGDVPQSLVHVCRQP